MLRFALFHMWWLLSLPYIYIFFLFGRYGCTKITISDQGREFVNRVNKSLFAQTRTEHRISTAYHPQTNGLVERYNQTLQRSLLKLVNKQQDNWDEFIDGVLFAYRTSKQKSTQFTPFELMYCRYVGLLLLFACPHCPPLGSACNTPKNRYRLKYRIIREYNLNSIAGNQFSQLSTRCLTLSLSVVWTKTVVWISMRKKCSSWGRHSSPKLTRT